MMWLFFIPGIGTLYLLSFFLPWPILGGYQYYFSFQGINSLLRWFFSIAHLSYIINLCSYYHYFFITTFFAFSSCYFSSLLRCIPTESLIFGLFFYICIYSYIFPSKQAFCMPSVSIHYFHYSIHNIFFLFSLTHE